MELKYEMNYKIMLEQNSSNCTFMELKYEWNYKIMQEQNVLIVPLWN